MAKLALAQLSLTCQGSMNTVEYTVQMDLVPAAGVIIINEQDQILLVQRGHAPQQGRWTIPGGKLEPGETPQEAAIREGFEETGLHLRIIREALHVQLPTADGRKFDVHDFVATVVGGTLRHGDDALDARWFSHDELDSVELTKGLLDYLREAGIGHGFEDPKNSGHHH